jgi:multiple sugar transport system permease protein
MVVTALQPSTNLRAYPPQFWPVNPQWEVFADFMAEHPFAIWVRNTLLIAFATMTVSLTVSILAAYALSRFRLRGKKVVGLFILTSQMLPATLLIIPLFVIFRSVGLVGSPWSVVIAQSTLIIPFCVWMLKGYFDTIPEELEHAALVDGCSPLGIIFRIVLPIAAPGLAATALYAFVVSWSDFLFGLTFLGGNDQNWTLQMGIASLRGEYVTEWNVIMAGSVLASIPIMIAYVFLEKYLVGGLAAGSEK